MHLECHNPVASENGFWIKELICIGRHGTMVSTSINILLCLCKGVIQGKLQVQTTGLKGNIIHADDLHCLSLNSFIP